MAVTRLSDAIVPEVFFEYMLKKTTTKSAIFQSGILRKDADMAKKLAGGGRTFNVPFWKDLADTEGNIASDNPASDATPLNITSGQDIARRQIRTQGWSTAKLVAELAGDDPMDAISERVSDYWVRQYQLTLVATLRGVVADNVANDSSDMINSIATDSASAITAAEQISAEAVLDAAQTMGDNQSELDTLIMHSVCYNRLQKLNLIDFIPDSEGKVRFPTYLGYRVIIDDGCPAVAGANRTTYHTYLVGKNALGWAEVAVDKPVAVDGDESLADGMGVEELWTRRQFVLHPYGIKFTDSSVAGEFPTNTELQTAANWDRVYAERKQVPIAVLLTNG